MPWDDLGSEKVDVILCISAIHYARDQQELIDLLMARLTHDGVLVLEIGCAPGEEETFMEVERSIDTRLFPTRSKIHAMLAKYAFKSIGSSVPQGGDPVPRHIYHVYHARPYAVTFLDGHYSGKTSAVKALIRPEIRRITGDEVYWQIAGNKIEASPDLREVVAFAPGTRHINSAEITLKICTQGLLPELLSLFLYIAGKENFVLDHFVPAGHRGQVCELLYENGYFVVNAGLHEAAKTIWTRCRPPYKQYLAYTEHLRARNVIDEDAYLAANPDVAEAVAQGTLPSGQYHYLYSGKKEKRKLLPEATSSGPADSDN